MGKLGDAFVFIRNGANIKQGDDNTGYPITRIETISNRVVNRFKMGYAGITDISKYKDYILQDGDILMSHINSEIHLGKSALYRKKDDEIIIHGMNLLCLRPNYNILDSSFVFYYFLSDRFLKQIPRITKKSVNQASFTVTALKELFIPTPSLETQKQIAANLDKVTRTIDLCNAILEKLDLLVKSQFVEMFSNGNYPNVRLGDYAMLQGGYAFKSSDFIPNGIKLVQIGNVNKDFLNWDEIIYLPLDFIEKYNNFVLNENDLVMAMTRPIIKTLNSIKIAKVHETDLPCLLNQRVGRFIIKKEINPIYLEYLCKFDDFKMYVERMSGNSLQPNISSKQVEDYNIILPPLYLQELFAAFVAQTDKSKSAVKKVLEKAETLKKALMQEYFG